MNLSISLFGHLRMAAADDKPLPAPRPRAQRLLAYLLLHRHRPLTREHIAFQLWPDSPEPHAYGSLRRALSDLRSALPAPERDEWLIVTDTELRWNTAAPYWLDINAYEQSLHEATPHAVHRAIGLYSGDLLAGWDEEWVAADRERLHQLQLNALRQMVAHHRAVGEYETGLATARQAIAHDRFSEAAHRDLMSLLYLAGDRAAAIAAYDHLVALLDAELGIEPMAESEALRAAIARGAPLAPVSDLISAVASPTATSRAVPALVGRDAETAILSDLWTSVETGHGRVVTVSGAAGIGKSRLVQDLADSVLRRGGLPLVGHCYEFEQALPYQAIVEMLRSAGQILRHSDLAPAYRATLIRLIPDVLGSSAGSPTEELTADPRIQLFEALWQAFLTLAHGQPLLLVVEDMHWAAESTIDWLTYIAPRLESARVLVVLTYRTDEPDGGLLLPRLKRRLERGGGVTALSVAPLSPTAHHEIVARLSGLPSATAAPLADRLFAETGGNPLFLHEIVRGLIETGQITVRDGRWEGDLIHAAPGADIPLPESLRELIAARVERLEPSSRTFIQAAAVAGRVFPYDIVQHATGWPDDQALTALEDVLGRGFISQRDGQDDFAFAHHLIQEVIYAGMTAPRRGFWHRRLAEALQALQPDDAASLAHHFSRAGDDDQARWYYLRAGDHARALAALDDASRHYHAALNRWPDDDPLGRAELLDKRGQCQWVLGELHAALASLDTSRALYESLGETLRIGDIERMIGRLYWEQSDREASLRHSQRALAILEQEPESVELARAISAMSQMHMLASEFGEAIVWGERALELAERLGAEDVAIHALTNIGSSLMSRNEFERGLEMLRDSTRRARAVGLAHDAMRANFSIAEQLLNLGRYGEAQESYEELLAYSRRVQADLFIGIALRSLIQLKWWTGRWNDALADRQVLHDWFRAGSSPRLTAIWADRVFGMLHNDLGQADLARQVLERELTAARSAAEDQTTVPHLAELARAYAALGREADASTLIHELLDWVDRAASVIFDCIMPLLIACQWCARQAGPQDLGAVQACVARLERADTHVGTPESRAALAEGRGVALLAEGVPARAAEHFESAVAGWASLGRPYDQVRGLGGLSDALERAGQAAAARAARDQALSICDTLAMDLPDPDMRTSFLASQLLRDLRGAGSTPT